MELHELIIKAHVHSHAAELAVQAKNTNAAWIEIVVLRKLLNDQYELEIKRVSDQAKLEASGKTKTPPPERSKR
ncbi:hypothetical protein ES708_29963 [subsurface metagenome]